MRKAVLKLCFFVLTGTLAFLTAISVIAAGTGADPLISLSYMTKVIKPELSSRIYTKTDEIIKPGSREDNIREQGDAILGMYPVEELADIIAQKLIDNTTLPEKIPGLDAWREVTLDKDWEMTGFMGCSVIVLEGSLKVKPDSGASFIDIFEKAENSSEKTLSPGKYVLVTEAGDAKVTFLPEGDVRLYVMGKAKYEIPISGRVEVKGTAVYGKTLSANIDAVLPKLAKITYSWKRDGKEITNATSLTYTLGAGDVGKNISVSIEGTGVYSKMLTSTAVLVGKAEQGAPERPTLVSKTKDKITIKAVSGCEYKIEGGNWQKETVFSSLAANTEYKIYMRRAETATHKASPQSESLKVKTEPGHPASIVSDKYHVNNSKSIISKIEIGNTVGSLISSITGNEFIRVYHKNALAVSADLLCTGMAVKLEAEGKVLQTLTAVVTGDVNGDGKITLTDFVQIKAHLIGKTPLEGCYFHAADINGDGKITLTDFVKMKAHLIGKEIIKAAAH